MISGEEASAPWISRADHVHRPQFTTQDIIGFSEEVIRGLGIDEETAAKIRAKYDIPTAPVADPPDVWDRLLADDDDK
jgi:hypothetical protein